VNTSLRRVIAGFEIAGAAAGLTFSTLRGFAAFGPGWIAQVVLAAGVGFFAALGLAGVLLWRNEHLGFRLSVLAQIAQVPVLTTSLVNYRAQTPVSINASFDSAWNLGLQADLGSYFSLVLGRHAPVQSVALNVLAVGCLVALLRAGRSLISTLKCNTESHRA
jgi:hypothetical protein